MPDGFDASHVPGVVDVPPPARRDRGNSTAVRVTEIVMRPLTLLVTALFALAGMVLWGVWMMGIRIIRPLFYTLAGIIVATLLLTIGGVAGYAYHAYQLANAKPLPPAGLADVPPAALGMPPFPSLPSQVQEAPQSAAAPPQADPFGLKRPGQ